jgi:NAD(P)-dependent dehydrogenase (short-subunit alcohol dehydrogenase family)
MTTRSILVAGASSGIGLATARLLDQKGYKVFAGVRDPAAADNLKRDASPNLTPVTLDVTKPDQVAAAVRTIETATGEAGLAAVINCAGIAVAGPLEFLSSDDVRRVFEVNFVGQLSVIQACLPLLRRGKGRIIQVTSGARNFGMPFLGAYIASKAGLGIMVDTLRRELRPWNIPVSEVLPGFVLTPLWDKYRAPADAVQAAMPGYAAGQAESLAKGRALFERMAKIGKTPEAVAKVILRAVESGCPRVRYVVGWDARAGLLAPNLVPPRVLDWFVSRALR